jgi:hypothetical protein
MKRSVITVACVLAMVALHGRFAMADDAPAGKAEKAPAAPAVSKADAAAGDEVLHEARAFVSLLRDGADEKAYERMSAEFRKENTAEQFAKDLGELRDRSPLPPSTSLTGDVWLKPKDGGPPRASLRTGLSRATFLVQRGGGIRPAFLTLSLVQEEGKWKVAALGDMRASGKGLGKAAKVDRKDPNVVHVSSSLEGKIVKVEEGSIVLRLEGGRNTGPVTERTLKLDEQTLVGNGIEMEGGRGRPAPGPGATARSIRITPGTLSDVKVDRRATVETSDDGTRAEAVLVMQQSDPAAPSEGL